LVGKKSFWALLVLAAVFLFLMYSSTGTRTEITAAEKVLRESFAPLQNGLSGMKRGLAGVSINLQNKKDLARQLAQIEKQNQELRRENQQLQESAAEVIRLRRLLDYKQSQQEDYDLTAARVIARQPNNWFRFITIDRGSSDGIKPGMAVISPDGLVGRVSNCSHNASQVTLITDREMAVGAIVQNSRETQGIIEGMGEANSLRMINIPYYAKVGKYERVVCSGLSQFYPKGILIGYIQSVEKEANGLLLTADIAPAVAFDKLEEVMVITGVYAPVADAPGQEE